MNKEIEEIKEHLDFAREVFDYTLNPSQCGLLLDYINQLEEETQQLKANRDEAIELVKKWDYENTMCIDDFYFQEELLSLLERGKE